MFTFVMTMGFAAARSQTISLTPSQTEGPYYAPNPPLKPDFRPDVEDRTPEEWPDLVVTGRVANQYGFPVPNAELDFWHADAAGEYDESSVGGRNGTYILRGHLFADELGNYEFNSIMPGLYPGRTRHVHFKVFDAQSVERLTSQFYWDSPFDNDVNADGTLDIPNGQSLTRDGIFRNNTDLLVEINNNPVAEGFFDTSFDFVIRTSDPAPDGVDFNGDTLIDATDLSLLYSGLKYEWNAPALDLNGGGLIDTDDITSWLSHAATKNGFDQPYAFGDSNLDGKFDSGDLVKVFQAGHFEDGIDGNSQWAEGDWNGDFDFDTGDLVAAFQQGRYDLENEAVLAVPEPTGILLSLTIIAAYSRFRRKATQI